MYGYKEQGVGLCSVSSVHVCEPHTHIIRGPITR